MHASKPTRARVTIPIDGKDEHFSPILLRDLCKCPVCIHEFTRQRLYSTTDIPPEIQVRSVTIVDEALIIHWEHDVPGFDAHHYTSISLDTLRGICKTGIAPGPAQVSLPKSALWDASSAGVPDFGYKAYMHDDATLLNVMDRLHSHGLVFITSVPTAEESVSAIAERMGPIKDTFYGKTWDVRTVPKANNVAYTSADLGFHTDLLYFDNPAHIQLLHCMQSSSTGGISVFVDAFKAALDLYAADIDAFNVLASLRVNYHYEHPASHLYHATKPVIDMRPLRVAHTTYDNLPDFLQASESTRKSLKRSAGAELPSLDVGDCLEKINWGVPFLAPLTLNSGSMEQASSSSTSTRECLNKKMDDWHAAAKKFSALLGRPEGLYERLMKPGECVLFNNTRVLHARKAFDSSDVGKARWLRGTYVDKDPFLSKLRVLEYKSEEASRMALSKGCVDEVLA
ncbi:hypothetical protein LTR91_025164 [Friedmanniomyces endolithicus]|uniref:TauD/TfdA-like domain-containing protein n=1 Tax=Friedmanniomyces endolithicus TaxID=329885 RepID=A0AAN6JWU0_9PEZI|nr:hypothetical protein LTR57_024877 [Friedmanniomyces endolithicus]KAK0951162.1 hypothetical protein LTR91_025164 [Friedmanniomyces endolithicus]KAK0952323.1 hypothetical protein LTS01_024884 [Friedmanniomyces endolithicus]KAK1021213.1 hypothetical protein LTS16_026666 [Friedmanniomyces endolithicus]